jgi:hypothetical protein
VLGGKACGSLSIPSNLRQVTREREAIISAFTDLCFRWIDAAWLAKLNLSESDAANVLRKWADHLIVTDKKLKALHLLLSLGDALKVVEVTKPTSSFFFLVFLTFSSSSFFLI